MTTDRSVKAIETMNEVIREARERAYHDNFYNGARAVQTKAYAAVDRRIQDVLAAMDDEEQKEIVVALWRGVLADIINAGDEVLKEEGTL